MITIAHPEHSSAELKTGGHKHTSMYPNLTNTAKILFSCCLTPPHTMQSNALPDKAHGPEQEFSKHSIPDLFNFTFNSLSASL